MEEALVILGLVVLTSVLACVVIAGRRRLSACAIRDAVAAACDVVALTLVFVLANAVVWSAFVVTSRMLTRYSPSFYVLADESLFVLSGLQALVFAHWLGRSPARANAREIL